MASGEAVGEGMRVCWPERGRAEVVPFRPPPPKAGELLVETEVTLISPGTERAFFLGLPNAAATFPYYPGYSSVGRVASLGEPPNQAADGNELRVGDRIASGSHHASHATLRADRCWTVPFELAPPEAVFFSLAAIALQGVRKARVEIGEPVLVLGLGLIGNLALQWSRLQGAFPVIGLDLDAGRRETAMKCGADATFDPSVDGTAENLLAATHGRGPAVVIEATGSPEAVNEALARASSHGRVVLLASTRGVTEANFYRDIHCKGLTLFGAHANAVPRLESSPGFWTRNDDTQTALRLLAGGRVRVEPLTSEQFAWREAPRAYELLGSWRKDVLGMLLRWQK